MFSRHFTAFSYINIVKKIEKGSFFRGKVPFIFDQSGFITAHASELQDSIVAAVDPLRLDLLARQSGFLQRNSKLKPHEFIDTLISNGFDHSQLSLQDCCNDIAQQHRKSLSKVALHKRFNNKSTAFLKLVLATQMASKLNYSEQFCWKPFSKVIIGDSCKFALPEHYKESYPGFGGARNGNSLMNMQYSFDLKHGTWEKLEFTKATQNDQGHSNKILQDICKDELHIRDLGFVTTAYLSKIVSENAFFLNRLHPRWKPVKCSDGKPIDWAACYLKMQDNKTECFETQVSIGKGKDAFSCRMIAVMVPDQVYTERIRRAQKQAKSHGSALSDEYKERCRFSVFITNVDEKILKTTDVIQLYRLRWQIELIFKNWKSILGIHKVKAVKKDRLECQLLARFIWILMNWKIFKCIDSFIRKTSKNVACSMWKFFKQARLYGHALRKIATGHLSFKDWCQIFIFPIINNILIEPKKGKMAAFQIVNDIFNP